MLAAVARACGGIEQHVVGKIIFQLGYTENIARRGVGPWLGIIGVGIRDGRNDAGEAQLGTQAAHMHALIGHVERHAQRPGIIIESAADQIGAAELVVDRDIAATGHRIQPHAERTVT